MTNWSNHNHATNGINHLANVGSGATIGYTATTTTMTATYANITTFVYNLHNDDFFC